MFRSALNKSARLLTLSMGSRTFSAASGGTRMANIASGGRMQSLQARRVSGIQQVHCGTPRHHFPGGALQRRTVLAARPMIQGPWGGSIISQMRGAQTSSSPTTPQANTVELDEVEWSPELCNVIYLLGRTGLDFELKYLQNAQVVALVPLAVTNARNETMWVNVEIWGPLAETAAQNIPKGRQIAIQGRLKIEKWQDKEGNPRSSTKVVVNQLKLVKSMQQTEGEEGAPYNQTSTPRQASGQPPAAAAAAAPRPQSGPANHEEAEKKWAAFFNSPSDYYDNRKGKASGERSPKYPDFKHKESGDALWLTSYGTPSWVASSIAKLDNLSENQKDSVDALPDLSPF